MAKRRYVETVDSENVDHRISLDKIVGSRFERRCGGSRSIVAALRGLMQLIPETARCYGVIDATDSAQNVDAGLRYLKTLQSQSGRLDHLIIGADMATSLASLGFF